MTNTRLNDKDLLKLLNKGKLPWTYENLERVKQMQEKGLTIYKTGLHRAWWELTDTGRYVMMGGCHER